jgi:NADPH:quinone reductase
VTSGSSTPRPAASGLPLQLVKAFGATVIGTAGTDEKVDFCRSLSADYDVNCRNEDVVA